ncbi:hypothetical protein AJ79_06763 [Helicocarpus griseus UAMH5409]|uniref:VWFA domain-containing protein n=1 Tax=Helicocarpus griseus UAMH5409 TaxID=1447875 RepID=A0A2B7X937_9EURO|nr:hypothetical protein AJ79_06763 [Helicocarpus griseus UAMH5409]
MGSVPRRGYKKEEEDFLKKLVDDVVGQFFREFRNQSSSLAPPKPPESKEEFSEYIWGFISKNLSAYYKPGNAFVNDLVQEAARRAKELTAEHDLESELTPKLATLGLYDFVILCDDSGSMQNGNRIEVLEDTCQRVAEIATLLQPQGISLRFLNSDKKSDGLANKDDVSKKVHDVSYDGFTPLGTSLETKVVKPFILDRINTGKLKKPLITIIITDGCPTSEPEECLKEKVEQCKKTLDKHGFGPAGAVFLISRVGNDPDAEEFMKGLRKAKKLREMLYCDIRQLDNQRELFKQAGNDKGYTSHLIRLCTNALDSQTKR